MGRDELLASEELRNEEEEEEEDEEREQEEAAESLLYVEVSLVCMYVYVCMHCACIV